MSRYIDVDKLIESECQHSCGEERCEDGNECYLVNYYKSLIKDDVVSREQYNELYSENLELKKMNEHLRSINEHLMDAARQ